MHVTCMQITCKIKKFLHARLRNYACEIMSLCMWVACDVHVQIGWFLHARSRNYACEMVSFACNLHVNCMLIFIQIGWFLHARSRNYACEMSSFACNLHVNCMWIFMIFTCETWFHPLFPYFAYFHMWKQIFFTCVSHVYCMQFTCEILHPFTCEKWSLHVMGHISHENVSWSHVNRMWKTGVHMRKIRMRTACEILTRTDVSIINYSTL